MEKVLVWSPINFDHPCIPCVWSLSHSLIGPSDWRLLFPARRTSPDHRRRRRLPPHRSPLPVRTPPPSLLFIPSNLTSVPPPLSHVCHRLCMPRFRAATIPAHRLWFAVGLSAPARRRFPPGIHMRSVPRIGALGAMPLPPQLVVHRGRHAGAHEKPADLVHRAASLESRQGPLVGATLSSRLTSNANKAQSPPKFIQISIQDRYIITHTTRHRVLD